MSTTSKGVGAMPAPGSLRAPFWDGKSSTLLEFFEEFEDLATTNGLTDAEKCRAAVRYVDNSAKRYWSSLAEFANKDYSALKTAILKQYPGADKGIKYNNRDLERVVATYSDEITTETDILDYYHAFYPIASWLVQKKKLSERDRDAVFWMGLHSRTRKAISRRLETALANYSRDEPPHYEEVVKAGRWVFSDDAFDPETAGPIASRLSAFRRTAPTPRDDIDSDDEEDRPRKKTTAPAADTITRRVQVPGATSATSNAPQDDIAALVKKLHGLDLSDANYAATYIQIVALAPGVTSCLQPPISAAFVQKAAPSTTSSTPATSSNAIPLGRPARACFGCGSSTCRLATCPHVRRALELGWIRSNNGVHVWPDGTRVASTLR